MKTINYKFVALILILLSFTASFGQSYFNINKPETENQAEISLKQKAQIPVLKDAKRARQFDLNTAILNTTSILKGDYIKLSLFENRNFNAIIQRKSIDVNGVTSLVLKLKEFNYAYGYIIVSKNSYLINIDIPELKESYRTKYSKQFNSVFLLQLDESKMEVPHCGTTSNETTNTLNRIKSTKAELGPSPTCLALPGTSDVATIRLLVVYTQAAENWADPTNDLNRDAINNIIATAISQANTVTSNNNLGISFMLAHSEEINYPETSASADLNALRNNTTVQALRVNHNADLVALFSYLPGDGIGGIANLLSTQYGNPNLGYSNTKVNSALDSYTFMHELAHNFGADHYRGQNASFGPTPWTDWPENDWSSGWRFEGNDTKKYGTVMTYTSPSLYADGLPTTTIPYLSDPSITYLGTATGDAALADNARTLKEIKHYITRYRNAAPYCTADVSTPRAFYITNVNMCEINHFSSHSLYSDVTSLATCMQPSELQRLTVQIFNSAASNRLKVWIDWNNDKEFNETDELAYTSSTGNSLYSIDITAPSNVTLGEKRMRIRVYDPSSPNPKSTPCGSSTFGEIEDYTINVVASHICDPLSLNDISTNTLKYFYNPESDVLTLKSSNSTLSSIKLYNLLGQQVLNKDLSLSTEKIDLSWLSDGLFIGKISVNDKIQTIKILKH